MPRTQPRQGRPHRFDRLAELRAEIDRIDAAMHALLIERGEIIDRLIAVEGTQESGSAFRPAREADDDAPAGRAPRGILPLDTVESIWRVIIATFTHVQAPYSVHADLVARAMPRCAIPRASISASRCRSCRIWAPPA